MKLGILSDTHNNIENTRRALRVFAEHGVERVIHCGDLTTSPIMEAFVGWDVLFVYGNMDRNRDHLRSVAWHLLNTTIEEQQVIESNGVRCVACHGDDGPHLERLILSGLYAYVFHGHTHRRRDEIVSQTRVINPGALGGKHAESRSVCVLDVETGQVTFIELEEA